MQHLSRLYAGVLIVSCSGLQAQLPAEGMQDSVTVAAGEAYQKSRVYQIFWGSNWRDEWIVPVKVPVVCLDSIYGGLTPYKKGGGNETNSLRLRTSSGKEYAIRSVNKSRKDVIPRLLRNSIVAHIIQDNVSMSHPYASLALPTMLRHAGIYHTNPTLVYITDQPALDSFNAVFANDLYILEERPDGDWSDAAYLGRFKKFYSTLDVIDELKKNKEYKADQKAYIKARLFDILVADWDKHHDNWKWGRDDVNNLFIPIPRDRDQALFTRNGFLNTLYISISGLKFMQPFSYKIKSVPALTSQDRKMDRIFARDMQMHDWLEAAGYLQQQLTDSVIVHSVMQLPSEVFAISGNTIIEKIKARRDDLQLYAREFYMAISKDLKVKRDDTIKPQKKKNEE
jgi:hypothetical protein